MRTSAFAAALTLVVLAGCATPPGPQPARADAHAAHQAAAAPAAAAHKGHGDPAAHAKKMCEKHQQMSAKSNDAAMQQHHEAMQKKHGIDCPAPAAAAAKP